MRYTVKAYLCTNFSELMHDLETDHWNEVEDFIWENIQQGYNCELLDNDTGNKNYAYAEDFCEETLNPEDLLRVYKKPRNQLCADLRMEQQEQM